MPSKQNREWLDYTIDLYAEKIDSVLKSYFDESYDDDKISSKLTPIELSNISCTLISKLLDTPDCVNNKHRVIKYREIFDILTKEIFDLCKSDEDCRILESYRIMEYFYKSETS